MAFVVVETTYEAPLTDERRQVDQDRLYPCLKVRGCRWLESFESADRRRKICLFEGPDAESVREALRTSRIPFDRAWSTEWRRGDAAEQAKALATHTV